MKREQCLIACVIGLSTAAAQPIPGECTFIGDCAELGSEYTTYCGSITNWFDVVDFDGDGRGDFLHANVIRQQRCMVEPLHSPVKDTWDTVEALFPQAGVEMYLLDHPDVPPLLRDTEWIELDGSLPFLHGFQPVRWVWNPTYPPNATRHSGFGICQHYTSIWPCNPRHEECDHADELGWLREKNPGIFGFRISKPDGWHLGWLKLEELSAPIIRPDTNQSWVKLVDYAVHPDPDTEIRAGEKARPALTAQFTAGGTLLSWSTNWPGWRLSWSPTLNPVAWAPVEGVATNTNRVTLATTNASGFFRLQETP